MANQRDLPEELLLNILWQLKLSAGPARDQNRVLAQTLFSCLLANKTLYRLAKPVLYHTINHKDLFRIAHHLAHNPALADQVRELSAHERCCHEFVRVMDDDGRGRRLAMARVLARTDVCLPELLCQSTFSRRQHHVWVSRSSCYICSSRVYEDPNPSHA